ncbi:hypothetical protein EK403_07810 [Hansschlegelia zhihuaiae]|uniref:Uncharacterized protein n=2 Tax=Hansschlegelia zhihuaiae TaxID=405005 RepID=A0A4Q0MKB0_9HYPH|nr:hypothetical protein EK403_07810 [Hansschlegelia zhihuaiae]
MFPDEHIFLLDFEAMSLVLDNPTVDGLLTCSTRLRKLLIDKDPLLHKLARKHQFKPKFEIIGAVSTKELESRMIAEGDIVYWFHKIVPEPGLPSRLVGLDEFLSDMIFSLRGTRITVRELITYVSNVGGGTHQGKPRVGELVHQVIHETARQGTFNGQPYPLISMIAITSVTLNGVRPLYEQLKS